MKDTGGFKFPDPGRVGDDLPYEPERYELGEGPRYVFAMDRRDFIKLLGGGLVVVMMLRNLDAAQGPVGGLPALDPPPAEVAAWVHIAEDGTVHVYSGKTEVGQNVRTMLTQVVAEEMGVPVEQVRMVLADTDVTPFDLGTFGSRSAPLMVPQIAKAATAAREQLIDMAAARWQTIRDGIRIEAGRVVNPRTGESVSLGDLTDGQELVRIITDDLQTTPPAAWRVAGTSVRKVNGRDIVTGRHRFPIDIRRPGMAYGKVLRAPAFHSELVSVDAAAAEALSGVTFVRDGELDTRRVGRGEVIDVNPTVMFVRDGGFVGLTAPTEQVAARAVAALTANWETRPNVSEGALFDHLRQASPDGSAVRSEERGSIGQGVAEADIRVRETYTAAYIAHVPLEPRAAVAEWSSDGKLTVWTGTQRPWGVRAELAEAFRIPPEQVRVIVPDTGSGYGGKHTGEAAIEAARLARAAGRPVKLVWSREEEFTWGYFRPAGVIDVASGVKTDGTITAWEFHNYNSGNTSIRPVYDIPHQRVVFHPSDSPLRQGSYRGLGAAANHFARESHMDELAARVGMDPLEFRHKNLKDARLRAVYDAGAERFGWGRRPSQPDRGYGLAGGLDKGGYISTFAEVSIDRRSGRVRIERVVASFECGAVLNPDQVRNQVEGAIVMGIGGALFEAIHFEDGKILNARLSRYRVPRFSDVPTIEVVILDRKDLPSAGAGESPIVGIAPAVGNAIAAATGVRLRSLPMVPNGLRV